MSRITKYEQETIILWNRGEETASVFTYEPSLKRRLAKYAREHPDIAYLEYDNGAGGVSYIIDKNRISIHFTAPYSDKRKRQLSEKAKKNGFQNRV